MEISFQSFPGNIQSFSLQRSVLYFVSSLISFEIRIEISSVDNFYFRKFGKAFGEKLRETWQPTISIFSIIKKEYKTLFLFL